MAEAGDPFVKLFDLTDEKLLLVTLFELFVFISLLIGGIQISLIDYYFSLAICCMCNFSKLWKFYL